MQQDNRIEEPADGHSTDSADVLKRIADAIRGVRFGSIEVVIQDSRVVQIERKEKFRLDRPGRRS